MTLAWQAVPASADLSERSSGTKKFFTGLTLTIAGFTPAREGWVFPGVDGAHSFSDNALDLLDDDAFSGRVGFLTTAVGPGAFLAQKDLGSATYTPPGMDPVTLDHTWLNFALFRLQAWPETMSRPEAVGGSAGRTCMVTGLLLEIVTTELDQADPFPFWVPPLQLALLYHDGVSDMFGWKDGLAYQLHPTGPGDAGDGGTFEITLIK